MAENGAGGDEGAGGGDWMQAAGMSDDLRTGLAGHSYENIDAMGTALVSLEKKIGAQGLQVPDANAGESDWARFYGEIGRPETADDYDFSLAEGKAADDHQKAYQDRFRATAHKNGLSAGQAKAMHDDGIAFSAEQDEAFLKAVDEKSDADRADLRRQWGGKHDENMKIVEAAIGTFVPDAATGGHLETILGTAGLAQTFYEIGKRMLDDSSQPGGGLGFSVTPLDAEREIKAMEDDKEKSKILLDSGHPQHADLVKRRIQLYQIRAQGAKK